jgi:dTDP-4-dehydrorhamnose reductase
VSDQWGRPTWTHDIAVGLTDLLISRQNLLDQYNKQIFHIGNSGHVNWSGYARFLLERCGHSQVKVREISSGELNRAAKRPANSVLNLDKAKMCLGLQLRPWQDALNDFLQQEYSDSK